MSAHATLAELLRNIRTLTTFPPVLVRLNLALNANSSVAAIAEIIGSDTDLTARTLRDANSSFYGVSGEVDSVTEAVEMIGVQNVRNLALATNAMTLFPGISGELINVEAFWRHSIACAVSARLIARQLGLEDLQGFFLTGLLHDVGRLAIYLYQPDDGKRILEEAHKSERYQFEVEREILSYDHGMVGAALLEEWQLPASIIYSVRYHHEPAKAPPGAGEVNILHLANLIAHEMQLGHSGVAFRPNLSDADWSSAGLSGENAEEIFERVDADYQSGTALFNGLF